MHVIIFNMSFGVIFTSSRHLYEWGGDIIHRTEREDFVPEGVAWLLKLCGYRDL